MKVYTCEKCVKGTTGCAKKANTISVCSSFVSYAKAALIEKMRQQTLVSKEGLTYKPFANLYKKGL